MNLQRNEFIEIIAPIAVRLRLEGSPIFPSVRIAQAAHETGWKIPSWNNLVGFKVGSGTPNQYWKGAYINKGTWEVYDGKRTDVIAAFRAYDTIEDSFRDQDELFKRPRYDRVRAAQAPAQQADMLYASGYATDPLYAQKLKNIIATYALTQYDREVENMYNELLAKVMEQQEELEGLNNRVAHLESRDRMSAIPEWAQEAVDAAVAAGVVDTPEGGSYDFYRLLTVLHRKQFFS